MIFNLVILIKIDFDFRLIFGAKISFLFFCFLFNETILFKVCLFYYLINSLFKFQLMKMNFRSFFGGKSTKEITIKQSSIISEPLKKDESILASSTLIEEIKQTIEVKQSTNDNLPTKRPLLITEEDSTPVRKRLRKAIDIESSDKDLIDFDSTDGEQISTPIDSPSIIDSPIKESIKSLNIESKLKDEVELKIENESDDELNDEEIEDIDQIESDDEEIGKDQKKDDKDDKLSTKKLINSKIPGKSIKSSTPKPKKSYLINHSINHSIIIIYILILKIEKLKDQFQLQLQLLINDQNLIQLMMLVGKKEKSLFKFFSNLILYFDRN